MSVIDFRLYEPIYWSRETSLKIRLSILVLALVPFTYSLYYHGPGRFVYLTSQYETMMLIYTIVAIIHYFMHNDEDKAITKLKGIIFHLNVSMQFLVASFYWIFLPIPDWVRIQTTLPESIRNHEFAASIFVHAILCIYIWFNLLTERTLLKKSNLAYLELYAILYS